MKRFFLLCVAVVAIVSCTDDGGAEGESPAVKEPLAIDATSLNFLADGGTNIITFTASEAWSAELINTRADGWCSIEPTSGEAGNGKITVTTTANTTPNDRSASIVIKAGTASKTIAVTQKQKDAITITTSKFEVAAEGGEVTIELQSNVEFSVAIEESDKSWITHQATRAMTPYSIVLDVEENTDTEKREADVIISAGNLTERVTIYQAGDKPSIVISKSEYLVPSVGETIAVEVRGDIDVEFEIPADVEWITENTTRSESTNTFYFDIAENEDHDQRTAKIKFTDKTNNLFETVKVKQMQKDALVVANDSYVVDSDGATIEIEIGHNVDFTTDISVDWITTSSATRAYQTEKLVFTIAENTSGDSRTGTITFTSTDGSLKQIVTVTQDTSIASNEIRVTLADTSYLEDLRTQVTNKFGSNATAITHIEGTTYSITLKAGYTKIPGEAFYEKQWLKSVVIGNGITSIGNYAFGYCYSLESITIPNSVTSIGDSAFFECYALESITIPNSVTSIGEAAFGDCISLESITIPNSVTSIGKWAFEWCTSLESITIPNSVTSIGVMVFYHCTSLESITIPNSVTSIGGLAFGYCSSLESITIPNSVTSIGSYAFCGCSSLKSFYGKFASADNRCLIIDGVLNSFAPAGLTTYSIPNSVTSIGGYAFCDCSSLESITIPNSVTSIGDSAFYGCTSLESITIPDSVTSIGNSAFCGCTSLESITIPNSVTSIGSYAFCGCSSLESITIPNSVTSIGEEAFEYCSSLESITIPNSVTSIGNSAFCGCTSLESITIPNSVTSIGSYAFCDCTSLESITIPNSVTSIGGGAFRDCTSLESITIPNSVTSIGDSAFYGCTSLESITIPNSVTSIGSYAFCDCSSLESVYCNPTTPPMLGHHLVFDSNAVNRKIYVPAESVNAYKTANGWRDYADDIYAAPAGN